MLLLRRPSSGQQRQQQNGEAPQARSAASASRTAGSVRDLRLVLRMVDADAQPAPRAARGTCRVELEAQKVHRRGLLVVLALEVLVGDGVDARGVA